MVLLGWIPKVLLLNNGLVGRGCSTEVEHTWLPGGCGFESRWVWAFFPTFLHQWSVLNQAWVETGSISTDWVKNTRPCLSDHLLPPLHLLLRVHHLRLAPVVRHHPLHPRTRRLSRRMGIQGSG